MRGSAVLLSLIAMTMASSVHQIVWSPYGTLIVWKTQAGLLGPKGWITGYRYYEPIKSAAYCCGTFAISFDEGTVELYNATNLKEVGSFNAKFKVDFWPFNPTDSIAMIKVGKGERPIIVGYDALNGVIAAYNFQGERLWAVRADTDLFKTSKLIGHGDEVFYVDTVKGLVVVIDANGDLRQTYGYDDLQGADVCGDVLAVKTSDRLLLYKLNGTEANEILSIKVELMKIAPKATVKLSPLCDKVAVHYYDFVDGEGVRVYDLRGHVIADFGVDEVSAIGWLNETEVLIGTKTGTIYHGSVS
ncbi:hypothetical protein IPA_03545 [Ignicoccus pacificus DSM 13166]|uniref:Uncharacterized protein n=1 Tax=Ignicoccus pacificus DSM 13166 TaxID=940294 RepID=A0A977KCP6_9CREN|nr:hypothetical protein IPA_03545 [Ignicoccus pacificus DSM 13166]